ncbi:MAG: hypothetical protein RTU30_10020 [Candidatus Thorarchaeota archaeon]
MSDTEWSIEKARLVYGLNRNDLHFLDITENGELCITMENQSITLDEIIKRVESSNSIDLSYTSSFTLRIPQLITYQIEKLKNAFAKVIDEFKYEGKFSAVYPVKVNQRKDFVTAVIASDSNYGLEAGTKAELLLIKSLVSEEKHRRIVCNGAKDPEYLWMIRTCIEEGYTMSISIESMQEVRMIVEEFEPLKTDLALRMKPYLTVEGHWSHSTGRDSKFGLSIHDLMDVVALLKETGFAESISTVMAHVGSQVTDMEGFQHLGSFMTEIYYQLREQGLSNLRTIDFGGGLPIDYSSTYSPDLMEIYARSIVQGITDSLGKRDDTKNSPNLMIESGRGITALGALLLVKPIEIRSVFPPITDYTHIELEKAEHEFTDRISKASTLEEISVIWNEFHKKYTQKFSSLSGIYESEMLIGKIEGLVRRRITELGFKEFKGYDLVRDFWHSEHIVVGNFSVFNSIADYVLVGQHFPIAPIKDLHITPETTVRLVDITCDSDGEFSQFHRKSTDTVWYTKDDRPITMPGGQMGQGIPVGKLDGMKDSYFAIGLIGAYQDAIEMDHNLLGDLPDVELRLGEDNKWIVRWISGAEAIEEILEDQGYKGLKIGRDPYMS